MRKVAFFISKFEVDDTISNYSWIANELLRRGISVSLLLIDTLSLHKSQINASGWELANSTKAKLPFQQLVPFNLREFTDFWIFSLGARASFLDKYQLLYTSGFGVHFINSLEAIMHLKSKYYITNNTKVFRHPETYASTDADELLKIVESSNNSWIAKPPAGSLGRDVFLLQPGNSNNRVILENLCGAKGDQYALVQKHISEIEYGEKRVLIAGANIVGQYKRLATGDHRTNLLRGARTEVCDLTPDETAYCKQIGAWLRGIGANYVGIDMVYPWVIEFNVVNPGGLTTIKKLTGEDLAPKILDQLSLT